MFRFRLCDADREKFGGPEWVDFDLAKAVDLDVDLLEQVEDATGYTILATLPAALDRSELKATRAALWLARHIAGVHEPAFPQFKPALLKADVEWVDDPAPDADPPEPANRAERRSAGRKRTAPPSGS